MTKKVLINCPACERGVSLEARACPKCGQPMKDIRAAYELKAKEDAIKAARRNQGFLKILTILFVIGVIGVFIKDITSSPFTFTHNQFVSQFKEKVEHKNTIRDEKLKVVVNANDTYSFDRSSITLDVSPRSQNGTERVKEVTLLYGPLTSYHNDHSSFVTGLQCVTEVFTDFSLLSEKVSADIFVEVQKILAQPYEERKKLKVQKINSSMPDTEGKTKDVLTIEIDPSSSYIKVIFSRP